MPGDRALVEQGVADRRASGRPRAGGAGSARSSKLRREDVGPERRRCAGRSACATSVISSSTGPSNCDDLVLAAAQHEPRAARRARPARRRARARATSPVMRRCEWIVRPPSKRRNRCLPWASTRSHRAAGQPLGPAVGAEARVRRRELVGHVALEHRPDPVRGVVDRVALGHRLSGYERGSAPRQLAPSTRATRGKVAACRRATASRCRVAAGSSGTPSFAAGSPASANSRWSELPRAAVGDASGRAARRRARAASSRPLDQRAAPRRRAQVHRARRGRPRRARARSAGRRAPVAPARRARARRGGRAGRCRAAPRAPVATQPARRTRGSTAAGAAPARRACRRRTRCRRAPGRGRPESAWAHARPEAGRRAGRQSPSTLRERPCPVRANGRWPMRSPAARSSLARARARRRGAGCALRGRGEGLAACSCCSPTANHTPPRARSRSGLRSSWRAEQVAVEGARAGALAPAGDLDVVDAGDHALSVELARPGAEAELDQQRLPRASRRPARRRRARAPACARARR